MLMYLASDLLWASKIRAAAKAAGIPSVRVEDAEDVASAMERGAAGLLVDLDAGAEALAAIRAARELNGGLGGERGDGAFPILAFGPHVETGLLAAAREAGASQALPRGAVASRLVEICASLAAGGVGEP